MKFLDKVVIGRSFVLRLNPGFGRPGEGAARLDMTEQ